MTHEDKAVGTFVAMALAAITALVVLIYLEVEKDAHQEAGGHEPTPQEECYELPGHGELASLQQNITFCNL